MSNSIKTPMNLQQKNCVKCFADIIKKTKIKRSIVTFVNGQRNRSLIV